MVRSRHSQSLKTAQLLLGCQATMLSNTPAKCQMSLSDNDKSLLEKDYSLTPGAQEWTAQKIFRTALKHL